MTRQELKDFEKEIADLFLAGKIRAPIHLSGGNEDQLIEIFKQIKPEDWVFSTYRSHYHALLKGIPKDWLRNQILNYGSMHINSAKHKFFTSAIVGGCLPIALGVALSLKRKNKGGHVWVFVGDMAAETGSFHECTMYAARHELPITFVIEDNSKSVQTPTQEVWGLSPDLPDVKWYIYENEFPHHGVGKFVIFG